MSTAYVALGGNEGDRLIYLEEAVRLLSEIGDINALSPLYETEPVGYADQPWYLNAVVSVDTELSPLALLMATQEIERKLDKATPFANGPRTIDLDILLYDDVAGSWPDLDLPHPRMHRRRFVLTPLADIVPDAQHPTLGTSIGELLAGVADDAQANPWDGTSRVFPNLNRRTEIQP